MHCRAARLQQTAAELAGCSIPHLRPRRQLCLRLRPVADTAARQWRAARPAPCRPRTMTAESSIGGGGGSRQFASEEVNSFPRPAHCSPAAADAARNGRLRTALRTLAATLAAAIVAVFGCLPNAACALTSPSYDDLAHLHHGRSRQIGSALPTSREAETIAELDKVWRQHPDCLSRYVTVVCSPIALVLACMRVALRLMLVRVCCDRSCSQRRRIVACWRSSNMRATLSLRQKSRRAQVSSAWAAHDAQATPHPAASADNLMYPCRLLLVRDQQNHTGEGMAGAAAS